MATSISTLIRGDLETRDGMHVASRRPNRDPAKVDDSAIGLEEVESLLCNHSLLMDWLLPYGLAPSHLWPWHPKTSDDSCGTTYLQQILRQGSHQKNTFLSRTFDIHNVDNSSRQGRRGD